MIPIEKNRGKTVLGVRIGLVDGQHPAQSLTESIVGDLLPCLQPLLTESSIYSMR